MGRTIPRLPPPDPNKSDYENYREVIEMLEDHKRKVQKDIDTSASFIGGLTVILALGLIAYLILRFTL